MYFASGTVSVKDPLTITLFGKKVTRQKNSLHWEMHVYLFQ